MKWNKVGDTQREKWEDALDLYEYAKQKGFIQMRLSGEFFAAYYHWLKIKTQQKGIVGIPVTCPRYHPDKGEFNNKKKCAACDAIFKSKFKNNKEEKDYKKALKKFTNSSKAYFFKAIIRNLQKKGKKCVRNVRITSTPVNTLKEFCDLALTDLTESLGKKRAKKIESQISPTHEKYGFDFMIKYNKNAKTPSAAYTVQYVGVTPLTTKEIKLLKKSKFSWTAVKPSDNDNIRDILSKSLLMSTTGSNDNDNDDEDDFNPSTADKERLLDFIDENEIISKKKAKKKNKKQLRKLVKKWIAENEDNDNNDNDNNDNDDSDDLEDMNKKQLLEYADENDIKLTKKQKKFKETKLRKLIEKLSEEDDNDDAVLEDNDNDNNDNDNNDNDDNDNDDEDEDDEDEDEPDFDSMNKKKLVAFCKENNIKLPKKSKIKAASEKKFRKWVVGKYDDVQF